MRPSSSSSMSPAYGDGNIRSWSDATRRAKPTAIASSSPLAARSA
jgi:hypothetical protein